jgi:hypothetical protein
VTNKNNDYEPTKCTYHPDTETYLRCSECGKPICPKCMVQTPVGAKCPDCARHRGRTARYAKPIYYIRAIAAGLGAGTAVGFVLGAIRGGVGFGTIILSLLAAFGIGEIISRAARRNTGREFQIIAAVSAAWMFFLAGYFTGAPVLGLNGIGIYIVRINPVSWFMAIAGIYLAAMKLAD